MLSWELLKPSNMEKLVFIGFLERPALQAFLLRKAAVLERPLLAAAAGAKLRQPKRKLKSKQRRPCRIRMIKKAALIYPMRQCAGSHALGGLALLRKAGARGLLHRPWGVPGSTHG